MKKLLAMLLALLAMSASAGAEDAPSLLPVGAVPVEGGWALPSGEVVELVSDESGTPIMLVTATAAKSDAAGEQSREGAEAAVLSEYPNALVLTNEVWRTADARWRC